MTIWWPLALLVGVLWTIGIYIAGYQSGVKSRERKGGCR
jgi:hypothetical protein